MLNYFMSLRNKTQYAKRVIIFVFVGRLIYFGFALPATATLITRVRQLISLTQFIHKLIGTFSKNKKLTHAAFVCMRVHNLIRSTNCQSLKIK